MRASLASWIVGLLPWLVPIAAGAQVTVVSGGNPNHLDLSMPVTASVANRCGFALGGTYTAPEVNAGFSHDFAFVLQCNVPSRVAVESLNGGLLAPGAPPAGYAAFAPYLVTLNLVGNAGVTAVSANCDAQALITNATSPCSFRGPATSGQGLRLGGASSNVAGSYLRVSAPVYSGSKKLIASPAYADTLTVTLSVAL